MRVLVFCLILMTLFTASSFADTVLTYNNPGPGNQIGGEYTYPYNFTIATTSGPVTTFSSASLICDTYSNSISSGESWAVTVNPLPPMGNGYFPSTQDYEAAAIIFSEILNNSIVDHQHVTSATGNLAIWAMFDGGRSNSGWTPYEQTLIDRARALVRFGHQSSSFYAQFQVYTPVGGVAGVSGPQEFIGCNSGTCGGAKLPEPASLPILASGLVALGGLFRRKF